MIFGFSDTLGCFNDKTVGTKVQYRIGFLTALEDALKKHDTSKDEQPGQHFVMLPPEAIEFVSAGCGQHTGNPDDYVVRVWRGQCQMFLKRNHAAEPTGLACVVYTRAAYKADPEVDEARFAEACPTNDVTHVIVAVLAFAGPKPPVGYERFVKNLAGANNEYDLEARARAATLNSGKQDGAMQEMVKNLLGEVRRIRELAKEVDAYHSKWCVVAD